MKNKYRRAVTLIELLVAVSIMGVLSVLIWRSSVQIIPSSREVLVDNLVRDLNDKVKLFGSFSIESGATNEIRWTSKEEALRKLSHKVSETNDMILLKTIPKQSVCEFIDWDTSTQQFKKK